MPIKPEKDHKITKSSRGIPKHIPIESIIEYSNRGLNSTEIAKLVGCDHSNIIRRLQTIGYTKDGVEHYKRNRADVFRHLQSRVINSITDEDIKKAPLQTKILALGVIYDKERLETGQSTANVSSWSHVIQGVEAKGTAEKPTSSAGSAPEILDTIPASIHPSEPSDTDEAP